MEKEKERLEREADRSDNSENFVQRTAQVLERQSMAVGR